MNPKIVIRNETHEDVCAISEVTIAAFKTLEISNHTERSSSRRYVPPKLLRYRWLQKWMAG